MSSRLWQGWAGSPNTFADSNSWQRGVGFEPLAPGVLSEVWWYRPATGAQYQPTAIRVWDIATSAAIGQCSLIHDDGIVGWQPCVLDTPIDLATGQDVACTAYYPAGRPFANVPVGLVPAVGANLAWLSPKSRYQFGNVFPSALNDTANVSPIDIVFEATDVDDPDDPPVNLDIDNALARWFTSTGDNLRQSELPWQTYVATAGLSTDLDTLIERIDAGGWPVVLGGINKADLPAWLSAAGTIISAISSVVQTLQTGQGAVADLPGDTLTGGLLALAAQIQNGDQRWLTAPGGAGWTLDATVPFTGPFLVNDEADHIMVNITSIGSANRSRTLLGLDFLTFPWWWVPLRAGAIVGPHHTCMALTADLYEPGRRLPGALVAVPEDFEGEYEVWRYTG
jgi:hypothetical protein